MRVLLTVLLTVFVATSAWANLGLPNEAANPGFEQTTGWTVSVGPNPRPSAHLAYSTLAPFGVPAAPSGGSFCGGIAGQSLNYGGGELSQVIDESLFPGWNPNGTAKIVEVSYYYYQYSLSNVDMVLKVYVDYMTDLSYPDPQSPLYVKQEIDSRIGRNSGGWKSATVQVTLPVQPRWLSVHFDFQGFAGTAINIIDRVDVQGLCIPEPGSLLALAAGLVGLVGLRRRR